MGKIEAMLREEIQRLARREIRHQVEPLRKENRELKRRIVKLEKLAKPISRVIKKSTEAKLEKLSDLRASEDEVKAARITPAWVQNTREKLNVTQEEMALLCDVSPSAVRSWIYGVALPRGKNREILVALRKLGRRDAKRLLEAKEEE
jgi:DNA-binding transcriptional regulator YiaG